MTNYTVHIPFSLAECNKCSALVPGHPDAIANHTGWHERLDVLKQNSDYMGTEIDALQEHNA
jgi:hypothetical protein